MVDDNLDHVSNLGVYLIPYHQPPHSLLLNTLILFFLLTLCVGMVGGHSFSKLLDLSCDGAMVFLKVFSMLEDTVEVFLQKKEGKIMLFREFRFVDQLPIVNNLKYTNHIQNMIVTSLKSSRLNMPTDFYVYL